ncbi:hypothetical protein V6N13_026828 [Hibiscus sabdariffa]
MAPIIAKNYDFKPIMNTSENENDSNTGSAIGALAGTASNSGVLRGAVLCSEFYKQFQGERPETDVKGLLYSNSNEMNDTNFLRYT